MTGTDPRRAAEVSPGVSEVTAIGSSAPIGASGAPTAPTPPTAPTQATGAAAPWRAGFPVTQTMTLLDGLGDRPLAEHPDVYQQVHEALQGALADIDDA